VFNATLKSYSIVHSLKILAHTSFKKSLAIQGVYRIKTHTIQDQTKRG